METDFYSPGRRDFIKKFSLGTMMLFALGLGGCEDIIESIKNRPTRRRIRPDSPEAVAMMEIYAEAVGLMKGLSSSDGRNWANQAAIHGSAGAFNFCQHRTAHFVSWHRAYLFYLEKICQTLTGEKTFGLPYWNWAMDRKIPAQFWNTSSPLYLAGRVATASDETELSETGHTTLQGILKETDFYLFASGTAAGGSASGELEATPHNYVHNFVGGTMAQGNSPLDPIFWTHHCMVDYMWFDWNINLNNANPSDPTWQDTTWTGQFVDGEGNPAEMSALSTTIMPLLSYQYEESQIGTSGAKMVLLNKSEAEIKELQKQVEKGAEIRFQEKERIPLSRGAMLTTGQPLTLELDAKLERFQPALERGKNERILTNIDFANFPEGESFFVRIFINMPEANAQTPIKDPHYAGSFSFFGRTETHAGHGGHEGHSHTPSFRVDITETLKKLQKAGALPIDQNLQFNFVTVPITPNRPVIANTLNLEKLDVQIGEVSAVLK